MRLVLGLPREARARTVGLLLHREELCLPPASFQNQMLGLCPGRVPAQHAYVDVGLRR